MSGTEEARGISLTYVRPFTLLSRPCTKARIFTKRQTLIGLHQLKVWKVLDL